MKQKEENKKEKRKKAKKKKYRVFSIKRIPYDFIRLTGVLPMWLFLRTKVFRMGKKKKFKGAILMANHIGILDPIILHYAFPSRRLWSLAMKELFETRAKRLFFTASNCIPVDRENVTIDMYHNVADVLSSGKILAMFPEGKINFDEQAEVKKFKGGAALFAIMNKVPVIPVYIVKRTKWYQRQKMVVGEPIYLEEICDGTPSLMDVEKVSEYLHSKEDELVAFYEEKCSKKKKEKKDND